MDDSSSAPRAVFITGIGGGIGSELAKRYQAQGFFVGGVGLEEPAIVEQTFSTAPWYRNTEVTDAQGLQQAITDFAQEAGRLDVVVANAGISMPKSRIPDFQRARLVFEVNVMGVMNTIEAALPLLKPGGKIGLLASIAGLAGLPGMAGYSTSKAAVVTLGESLAIDLKTRGISVSTICLGFVKTQLTAHNSHDMPFMMTAQEAAGHVFDGIESGRALSIRPRAMMPFALMMRFLPRWFYRWLVARDFLGFVKE